MERRREKKEKDRWRVSKIVVIATLTCVSSSLCLCVSACLCLVLQVQGVQDDIETLFMILHSHVEAISFVDEDDVVHIPTAIELNSINISNSNSQPSHQVCDFCWIVCVFFVLSCHYIRV